MVDANVFLFEGRSKANAESSSLQDVASALKLWPYDFFFAILRKNNPYFLFFFLDNLVAYYNSTVLLYAYKYKLTGLRRVVARVRRGKTKIGWGRWIFTYKYVPMRYIFFSTVDALCILEMQKHFGIGFHVFNAGFFFKKPRAQVYFLFSSLWWYSFTFLLYMKSYIFYVSAVHYNEHVSSLVFWDKPLVRNALMCKFFWRRNRVEYMDFYVQEQYATYLYLSRFIFHSDSNHMRELWWPNNSFYIYENALHCSKILRFVSDIPFSVLSGSFFYSFSEYKFLFFVFWHIQNRPRAREYIWTHSHFPTWMNLAIKGMYWTVLRADIRGAFFRHMLMRFFNQLYAGEHFLHYRFLESAFWSEPIEDTEFCDFWELAFAGDIVILFNFMEFFYRRSSQRVLEALDVKLQSHQEGSLLLSEPRETLLELQEEAESFALYDDFSEEPFVFPLIPLTLETEVFSERLDEPDYLAEVDLFAALLEEVFFFFFSIKDVMPFSYAMYIFWNLQHVDFITITSYWDSIFYTYFDRLVLDSFFLSNYSCFLYYADEFLFFFGLYRYWFSRGRSKLMFKRRLLYYYHMKDIAGKFILSSRLFPMYVPFFLLTLGSVWRRFFFDCFVANYYRSFRAFILRHSCSVWLKSFYSRGRPFLLSYDTVSNSVLRRGYLRLWRRRRFSSSWKNVQGVDFAAKWRRAGVPSPAQAYRILQTRGDGPWLSHFYMVYGYGRWP